jgi:pimeloyl-ACP methyl ester carboxylesterase
MDIEQLRFNIHIPEDELSDLKNRLKNTRWPPRAEGSSWDYGVNQNYLRELVEYWINAYNWRGIEEQINRFTQYRIPVDGVPVHFIYQRGKGSNPIPLILTHGWPWSFWDIHKIIGPLTDPAAFGASENDAFDVVVPSLPGYGFSGTVAGMNFWKTADLWHKLMVGVFGYKRYAASGGDWGALVTSQLGHKYAASLFGIHLLHTMGLDQFNRERPWDVFAGHKTAENTPMEIRQQSLERMKIFASHYAVHILDPQTIAYGLQDSPLGLLAWLLERWRSWSQTIDGDVETVFPKEHMITNAMLYWITGTVDSSMRFYADSVRYPWQPVHGRTPVIEAPAGITFLGGENPAGVSTAQRIDAFRKGPKFKNYNIHYLNAHEKGGHFGYYENPDAIVGDIRATFRDLR